MVERGQSAPQRVRAGIDLERCENVHVDFDF